MLEEYLDKNNLIICPSNLKEKIVKEINRLSLVNYKLMTKKEFLDNYFFSYDKKTIYYVMKKYNTKYSIALEYLDSLYYLVNEKHTNSKLNELVELKKELLNNNLLYSNDNFLYYLKHTNILVYGYELDPFFNNILSEYNYKTITITNEKRKLDVLEFNDIDSEIAYICSSIKNDLDSGIDIENIKIVNNGSEYNCILKRIFGFANIPIDLDEKISIYDLEIGKKIIEYLKINYSFEDIISNISNIETNILNKIISIFNNYIDINIDNIVIEMITYDLKHSFLPKKHLNKAIRVISLEEVNNNDFVYVIGFNKENYPRVFKDEDFLSDLMKKELDLYTSNDNNKIEKNKLKNLLYKNINYTITYKLKDLFSSYNPSIIINELEMNVISDNSIKYDFSNLYNKIKLVSDYDNFYKYGTISNSLKKLNSNYNIDYDNYDNRFTGINNDKFINSFDKLSLSYSSLDNYFRCSFRYYINNILDIKEESKDEFYMNIGNIFHYVLSKYRETDFDFNKYWNEEASKYEFTIDKLILLNKLKEELKYDIEIIKKQENYSKMNDYLFENKFYVNIPNNKNKNVYFTGIIDKIIYTKQEDKTLVSIIDYKTGTLHKDLSNVLYGIGMQLPTYLYLIKRSNLFPNSIIVGFYLQRIINKDVKATLNKDISELKEEALKLVGYSTTNTEYLGMFDMTYNSSNYITSLKTKNDGGFYNYSKVLDDKEIDNLDKVVSDNINKAANSILEGDFKINPKRIDNIDIGCENCTFKDICFKKERDYEKLEKHTGLDFLGGDNNA